jgi:hydroxymethylbilane synthase
MLPAIGQGVVALQCRESDERTLAILAKIHHAPTAMAVRLERELQRLLSGDCSLPVGIHALMEGSAIQVRAILFPPEGGAPRRAFVDQEMTDPEAVAADLFHQLTVSK